MSREAIIANHSIAVLFCTNKRRRMQVTLFIKYGKKPSSLEKTGFLLVDRETIVIKMIRKKACSLLYTIKYLAKKSVLL